MNVLIISILLLVRVLIPLVILLMIGEWVRRREVNYWSRM